MVDRVTVTHGTTADWAAQTIPLAVAQFGQNTDTGEVKMGDGNTLWSGLPVAFNVAGTGSGSGGGTTVSDATTTSKGVVQLAGDLAGTAASPALAAISGLTAGSYTNLNATVDAKGRITTASNGSSGGSGAPDATTSIKGIVQLAGDLGGTSALPRVLKLNGTTPATVATTGSYTDLSNKPTIPAAYTDEQVRDVIAAAIAAGTQTGITVVYDDANDKFSFTVTGGGGGTAVTYGVFRPEDYGAVADGTTDDSTAITNMLAAASAASHGTGGAPVQCRNTAGKTYRIKNSIIVPSGGNISYNLNGSTLQGPITGYDVISSSNNPAVPAVSDVAGQTAGACFTDNAGQNGVIYGLEFYGHGTISGFRYGFVTKCFAWSYAKWQDVTFGGCNIGIFCYQGSQEHRLINPVSNGQGGVTYVGSATAFPSGHPYSGNDNYFTDGLIYDGVGWNRDSGRQNSTFDTWFSAAILRPTALSVTAGTPAGQAFGFTDADSKAVTGRVIYIPSRNGRSIFSPNIRRLDAEGCERSAVLLANLKDAYIGNIGGEGMWSQTPGAMVVILQDDGGSSTGVVENINAQDTTNVGTYAVEIRVGSNKGGGGDFPTMYARNVRGPNWNGGDPWASLTNQPAMFMHSSERISMYYNKANSTTSLADADSMAITVPAACTVQFRATLYIQTDATTTGVRAVMQGPTASEINYRVEGPTSTSSRTFIEGISYWGQPASAFASSASTSASLIVIEGMARVTAGGQLKVQFASEVAGSNVTLRRGSTLEYTYVAGP
jgi:hypothetical protein